MRIRSIRIEDGCISCSLCQDYVPEVFLVEDGENCVIREDATLWFERRLEDLLTAAEDCPVEVIRIDGAGPGPA